MTESKSESKSESESKPEPFKCVCVYEIQDWMFSSTREEFEKAVSFEIEWGGKDILKFFMDEYDKRKKEASND